MDPAKQYSIAIIANPSRQIEEANYDNNIGLATVVFGDLDGYETWGTQLGASAAGAPAAGTGTGAAAGEAGAASAGDAPGAISPAAAVPP